MIINYFFLKFVTVIRFVHFFSAAGNSCTIIYVT